MPYSIPGGSNIDRYPLMEPYGNLRANNNGPYYDFINNPIQFKGFVCCGTPPYTWLWDFGDGNISIEPNPIHSYKNIACHLSPGRLSGKYHQSTNSERRFPSKNRPGTPHSIV